jgi:uncharacterized protein YjiK
MLECRFVHFMLGALCALAACSSSTSSTGTGSGGATVVQASGGSIASGGEAATGGASHAGGAAALGGLTGSRGTGGSTGGSKSTGGATSAPPPTGGAFAFGGASSAGGAVGTGGATGTGGASSIGGTSAKGGASATGGASGLGGASSTGGASAVGGTTATGGTSAKGGATGTATPLDSYVRTQGPLTLSGVTQASGVAWKTETNTFFVVDNGTHALYEFTADFKTRLRTVVLNNGGTDTEDVVYLGSNRFAVVDEENQAYVVTISDGATSASMSAADAEHYVVTAPPATVNRGFEGIAFRPGVGAAGQLIVCQEGGVSATPIRVLFFSRRTTAGTSSYADGTLSVSEPWNALNKLGAVATDLASIYFDTGSSTLLVLSQESSRLLRVSPETGQILDQRDLSGSPQYEGVTLADGGRLVVVSEPNYVEVYQTK